MSVEEEAEVKLALSRLSMKDRMVYLIDILLGFVPVQVPGLNTAGVTKGMVLYYDPAWLLTCTQEHIDGVHMHEMSHVFHHHLERIEEMIGQTPTAAEADLANKAADASFNDDNLDAGFELPEGKGIYAADFGLPRGLLMEEIYAKLKKESEKQKKSPQKGQSPGAGGGEKGDGPSSSGSSSGKSSPPGPTPGGDGHGEHHTGGCGGIAGNPRDFEDALDAQYGRPQAEVRDIVKKSANAVKEYMAAHGRGSVPGNLVQTLEQFEERSKIRWQQELSRVLQKTTGQLEAGGTDFSLARPSKRSYARSQLRPGLIAYQPEVAIVVDTSGSMGTPQIKEAIVQTIGVLSSLGVDTAWFIQADTKVTTPPKRVRIRDLKGGINIHGRGGTHFDDALRAVEKLKPRPDLVVYFTDGDGAATYKPRGMEVVWCVVPSYYNNKPDANFGHLIVIEANGKKKVA